MSLGLGVGMGAPTWGDNIAVVIEDYFWKGYSNGGEAGELTPLAKGTVSDFHDVWDLDGDNNFMPLASGTIRDEGYWSMPDDTSIQPLDV
jgi:hypothetical protein